MSEPTTFDLKEETASLERVKNTFLTLKNECRITPATYDEIMYCMNNVDLERRFSGMIQEMLDSQDRGGYLNILVNGKPKRARLIIEGRA